MINEKRMPILPKCAHCNGTAILYNGRESGHFWVDCEHQWEDGYHTTTGRYNTEEDACAAWKRNVAFDVKLKNGESPNADNTKR